MKGDPQKLLYWMYEFLPSISTASQNQRKITKNDVPESLSFGVKEANILTTRPARCLPRRGCEDDPDE
jgi:hypothetical protein